jgi:hypothetical protein
MGKRNKSTPPLIVDTIHTMKTRIKSFCQLCNQNMFSDTFVQLSPIPIAQLHCFVLHMLQKKSLEFIIWTLEHRGIQSMIMGNSCPSSNLGTGHWVYPKKNWNLKRRLMKHAPNEWVVNSFISMTFFVPQKLSTCACASQLGQSLFIFCWWFGAN